ncbi:hypothetical protein UlMin_028897 [Ulmus minor]
MSFKCKKTEMLTPQNNLLKNKGHFFDQSTVDLPRHRTDFHVIVRTATSFATLHSTLTATSSYIATSSNPLSTHNYVLVNTFTFQKLPTHLLPLPTHKYVNLFLFFFLVKCNSFFNSDVTRVFFESDFVIVTKLEDTSWDLLKPETFATIMDFYSSGQPLFLDTETVAAKDTAIHEDDSETIAMIKELSETPIRPAVQDDSGDIEYQGFDLETGIVTLRMRACSGCPSSSVTLKLTQLEHICKGDYNSEDSLMTQRGCRCLKSNHGKFFVFLLFSLLLLIP